MRKTTAIAYLFLLSLSPLFASDTDTRLRFIHREGEVLHADSLVDESVYINGYLSHRAEIDEFSVSKVLGTDEEGAGRLETVFRTVERVDGMPGYLEWVSAETVILERDSRGLMDVPVDAARPVLRSMPRFPERAVAPGDAWSLPAEEVHVFRIGGGLYGPYRGDVQVLYEYLDNINARGKTFARLGISYDVYLPVRSPGEPIRLITGRSQQELLWDLDLGRPERRSEDFEFMMVMADGRTQEFAGRGETSYRYTRALDKTAEAETIREDLEGIPGLRVETVDNGVLLSLLENETVLFDPESAVIGDDRKQRLKELSRSLEAYADRDILISGHTAHYGTSEGRKRLSRERAAAVADQLFPQGRPGPGRLFLRGAGSDEPRGEDMLDRRVEILILD